MNRICQKCGKLKIEPGLSRAVRLCNDCRKAGRKISRSDWEDRHADERRKYKSKWARDRRMRMAISAEIGMRVVKVLRGFGKVRFVIAGTPAQPSPHWIIAGSSITHAANHLGMSAVLHFAGHGARYP